MTGKDAGRLAVRAGLAMGLAFGWAQGGWAQGAKPKGQRSVPPATVHADGDQGMAGETPLDTTGVRVPEDVSAEGSPLAGARVGVLQSGLQGGMQGGMQLSAETPLMVKVDAALSSGVQRNGDTIPGVLVDGVRAANGKMLPAGTPVKVTVLSAAKAGLVSSAGMLSLQVMAVGGIRVVSSVLEFDGQEGRREVADANPAKGTEATVQAGVPLEFRVMGTGETEADGGGRVKGVSGASVSVGRATVGAPQGAAKPAEGSTPTTAIHGMTTPH